MAASTEPISGVNVMTLYDSTVLESQEDATLNLSQDLADLVTKNNDEWVSKLSGQQEWSVDQTSNLVDSSTSEEFIANKNAKLELNLGSSSSPNWTTWEYLDSVDFELEQNVAETGAIDKPLWRFIRPAERMATLDIEGSYLDPASSIGDPLEEVLNAKDNSNVIPVRFTLLSDTFEFDVAPGDLDIDASGSEDATLSLTMESDKAVTHTGSSFGTTHNAVFTTFFNKNTVGVAIEHRQDSGSAVTDSTTYTGDGYYTSISLTVENGEPVTMETTVEGDGKLDRSQIS